jgi:hypothetical protein
MLDPLTLVAVISGVVAAGAALVVIPLMLRGPRLTFGLIYGVLPLTIGNLAKEIRFLMVQVENNKRWLGDSARDVQCSLLNSVTMDGIPGVRGIANPLPWVKDYPDEVKLPKAPSGDFADLLEPNVFERGPKNIPQGHSRVAVVLCAIKDGRQVYFAASHPIHLRIPEDDRQMVLTPMLLEVAGDNVPSTRSEGTVVMTTPTGDWTVPNSVRLLSSPNKLQSFGMKIGIRTGDPKVLAWAEASKMKMRGMRVTIESHQARVS